MRNSTVCTRHDALKLFFAFLEDEDDLPSPMRKVRRPAEQEIIVQPLTEDQLAALLDTCKGRDFESRRDLAILRVYISTPVRLSEIALLRLDGPGNIPDIDPLEGHLWVIGKGRRPRQMSLSPKACKTLLRYEKVRGWADIYAEDPTSLNPDDPESAARAMTVLIGLLGLAAAAEIALPHQADGLLITAPRHQARPATQDIRTAPPLVGDLRVRRFAQRSGWDTRFESSIAHPQSRRSAAFAVSRRLPVDVSESVGGEGCMRAGRGGA